MHKYTIAVLGAGSAILFPQLAHATEQLYVSPFTSAPVEVISTSGTVVNPNFTPTNLSSTADVAFDPTGNVYISSVGSNQVLRYTSSGTALTSITGFPSIANQRTFGLAFGPLDGALYVSSPDATNTGNAVSFSRVTNPASLTPTVTNITASIPNAAAYIAFAPTTTYDPGSGPQTVQPLYYDTYGQTPGFPDTSAVYVAYINASGTVLNPGGTLFAPVVTGEQEGIAIGANPLNPLQEFLYVANYRNGSSQGEIDRYDVTAGSGNYGQGVPSGINTGAKFATLGSGLTDIALDSAGNLYVVNLGGTIYKYTSTGLLDNTFATSGQLDFSQFIYGLGIESLTEIPTPEPATLTTLALGTLTLLTHRRKK